MDNKPEVIEFDVVTPDSNEKILKADKIKIELYNNYLTYYINYLIEQEFVYKGNDAEEPTDEFLRKLTLDKNTETKKITKQDEGQVPLNSVYFSTEVQNQLGKPSEKTTLLYLVIIEYPGNYLAFYFKDKKEQKEVYNKLITWQINQNKWS